MPRGTYKNPTICDAENLRAARGVLGKATIRFGDFEMVAPGQHDFIYCDPPYDGTFAGYDSNGFNQGEQRRLRDAVLKWHRLGANVMISSSDTALIRSLYGGDPFTVHEVSAPRTINSQGDKRGAIPELLITTYD